MLVMSCNVAGGLKKLWPSSLEVLQKNSPDLIGFQELQQEQKDFYLAEMPEYDVHCTLDNPDGGAPVNGIFYRKDMFNSLSCGAHWLSETPHICGSSSWGSVCIRLVNWMILREKCSGKILKFYNTHLDHVNQMARERQSAMINETAAAHPLDLPQILTGDMNAAFSNTVIKGYLASGWRDTYSEVHQENCPGISAHYLEGDACERQDKKGRGNGRIDWIFVRGPIKVNKAWVVKDTDKNSNFPSDHFFIAGEIEL